MHLTAFLLAAAATLAAAQKPTTTTTQLIQPTAAPPDFVPCAVTERPAGNPLSAGEDAFDLVENTELLNGQRGSIISYRPDPGSRSVRWQFGRDTSETDLNILVLSYYETRVIACYQIRENDPSLCVWLDPFDACSTKGKGELSPNRDSFSVYPA